MNNLNAVDSEGCEASDVVDERQGGGLLGLQHNTRSRGRPVDDAVVGEHTVRR